MPMYLVNIFNEPKDNDQKNMLRYKLLFFSKKR